MPTRWGAYLQITANVGMFHLMRIIILRLKAKHTI